MESETSKTRPVILVKDKKYTQPKSVQLQLITISSYIKHWNCTIYALKTC